MLIYIIILKLNKKNSTINVKLQKNGTKALLSIEDEGIGIPESMLDDLFSSLPEIQRSGTDGEPSYGLGLKISKEIVEQHKGIMWAESEEGKGSTFFIMLPVHQG